MIAQDIWHGIETDDPVAIATFQAIHAAYMTGNPERCAMCNEPFALEGGVRPKVYVTTTERESVYCVCSACIDSGQPPQT